MPYSDERAKVYKFLPNTVTLTDPKASSLATCKLQTNDKLFSSMPASTKTDNGSTYISVSAAQKLLKPIYISLTSIGFGNENNIQYSLLRAPVKYLIITLCL